MATSDLVAISEGIVISRSASDVVQSRTYETTDAGDKLGQRMRFSVLYEDVLVELRVKCVSSEVVFDILQQIKK